MASKIKDIDHGWKNIKNEVRKLKGAAVRIGIHQDAGMAMERTPEGRKKLSAATTMAQVAYYNEFGTRRGIPERPFIRTTADEKRAVYAKFMKQELFEVFKGRSTVQRSLERVGALAQGHVRKKIRAIKSPANAPSTIAAKGSSNPLVDTGHLIKKIDYQVKGAKA